MPLIAYVYHSNEVWTCQKYFTMIWYDNETETNSYIMIGVACLILPDDPMFFHKNEYGYFSTNNNDTLVFMFNLAIKE